MKTRNGFVSNSSSSSFIIHLNKEGKLPCKSCGKESPIVTLIQVIDNGSISNSDQDNSVEFTGDATALLKFLDDRWTPYEKYSTYWRKDHPELIEQLVKAKNTDRFVYLTISYHDALINYIIKNLDTDEVKYAGD